MRSELADGRVLRLRAPEPGDAERLYLWENLPGGWRYGCSPAPYSHRQIWEYIRNYRSAPLADCELRLIIEVEGEAVGTVDLYNIDIRNRRAMVGVMTDVRVRRQGFALEALRLMAGYCRDNLGLYQLAATVGADNGASLGLFEKGGYEMVAHLPQWLRRGKEGYEEAIVLRKVL